MIICVGEILVDIFCDGNKEIIKPGGAPYNVASNALLYTTDVAFIGAVGNDSNGELLLNNAAGRHFKYLNINKIKGRYTSRAIVALTNGERSFRFERDNGTDYLLSLDDIDFSLIKRGDIVHIGSLMLSYKEGRTFYKQLINKIKKMDGVMVSFDINYRDDILLNQDEAKRIYIEALKQADILKFSIDELLFLSDKTNIKEALDSLVSKSQVAVVTLGEDGSMFYHQNKLIKIDSIKVKPVDTTGAGDAFYAYFLSAINNGLDLTSEEEIKKQLYTANIVGALTTEKLGAIDTAPSLEIIKQYL